MDKNKLESLKDRILKEFTIYTTGFANIENPVDTNIYLNEEGNGYVGISDTLINSFYIRSLKESTYSPLVRGCRVQSYQVTTQCRIVSVLEKVSNSSHEELLVSVVSAEGHAVTKVLSDKTSVFKQETGTTNINNRLKGLSLISCDFEVVEIVPVKHCKQVNCEC